MTIPTIPHNLNVCIRVTTTQRKGLMISHQTRPTLHLYDQYRNQPFQCSHPFHFKELYAIISLHNHFSNACSSHFYGPRIPM